MKRARNCEGSGPGEKPTAASPRRVMGVEKEPEGRGAGRRAAGAPSRARQKLSERPGPSGEPAGRGGAPWSRGPAKSVFRKLGKRTSAELSLVQPPQLAFVVLGYWHGRSDEDECVSLHVGLVGYNGANRILLSIFRAARMSVGFSRVLTYYIMFLKNSYLFLKLKNRWSLKACFIASG